MGRKTGERRRENWLLIKERDAAATPGDDAVTAKSPLSVATGRSLDEIAADRDRVWEGERDERSPAALAVEHDMARAGPPAAASARSSVAHENLAARLHRDGWDLTGVALEDRKALLAELIAPQARGLLRYSDHHAGSGPAFFRHACHLALEGIVSKRRDRPYRPGHSGGWLKVKCENREEFVVIGFTDPAGSRQGLGALVLGYYDRQGQLHYAGRVGTGFGTDQLIALRRRLDPLMRRDPLVHHQR